MTIIMLISMYTSWFASCCMSSNSIFLQIKKTPLHIACKNGHTGTAQMLIDRGADVNQQCGVVCYVYKAKVRMNSWACMYMHICVPYLYLKYDLRYRITRT